MFIYDKKIAVNTQGIRYVQKYNSVSWNSQGAFGIRIKYKAAELVENYTDEKDRDNMYDQIVKELTKGK